MTHPNDFFEFYNRYKPFQIYELRPIKNKLFYLISKTKIMFVWKNQPLEFIILPKLIITFEEENFITKLTKTLLDHLLISTITQAFGKSQ